jgi:two-component system, response regulator, stage 0 sporulation protein F
MSKKILYIEDEEELGTAYKDCLNQAGFKTKWVLSVPSAEELAKTFQPDLLLVDNGLKEGKNGIEAIPDLKKVFPEAKIVILSNYKELEKMQQAKELGANEYWTKIDCNPLIIAQKVSELFS